MLRRDGHTGARRLHGRPRGWGKGCCEGMATLGHDTIIAGHWAGARDVPEGWPHCGMAASWPATGLGQGTLWRDGHSEAWQHKGQPLGSDWGYCGGAATVSHDGILVSSPWAGASDVVDGWPQLADVSIIVNHRGKANDGVEGGHTGEQQNHSRPQRKGK